MVSKSGPRRLYDMEDHKVVPGTTYQFKRGPAMKFVAGRPYLIPVN